MGLYLLCAHALISIGVCRKWSYTLLKQDALKDKTTPQPYGGHNNSESALLNLPPEIRLEIWRLLVPHNEKPKVMCEGRYLRRDDRQGARLCSGCDELDLLKISHQLRSELSPLFAMRDAVFQFCTEVCAKRFMGEIAGCEELGVSNAVVELIHVDGLMRNWCGTGRLRARRRVAEGYCDPSYAFQVTFT